MSVNGAPHAGAAGPVDGAGAHPARPDDVPRQPSGSRWHRWQLTAPLAALSRPLRRTGPSGVGMAAVGLSALDTAGSISTVPGSAAAAGNLAGPAGADIAAELEGFPVILGGARAHQVDGTTCGSAVLVMLAATGDPDLARWLETGELPDGPLPPEIPPGTVAQRPDPDAAARFAAAQHRVKERTLRRALGPLPWPGSLGTPPWTAAREARFAGARYRVRPVDDGVPDAVAVLERVAAANRRGYPVPLYTGGDLRRGPAHAVPRHVVLAVPPPPTNRPEPGVVHLYEPGHGNVHRLPTAALLGRTTPHPALGGWTHVVAALLPEPA